MTTRECALPSRAVPFCDATTTISKSKSKSPSPILTSYKYFVSLPDIDDGIGCDDIDTYVYIYILTKETAPLLVNCSTASIDNVRGGNAAVSTPLPAACFDQQCWQEYQLASRKCNKGKHALESGVERQPWRHNGQGGLLTRIYS